MRSASHSLPIRFNACRPSCGLPCTSLVTTHPRTGAFTFGVSSRRPNRQVHSWPDSGRVCWPAALSAISELVATGSHPLDGARFLRKRGHEELAGPVAHHSGARREAKLRGLEAYEDEFPFGDSLLDRALTYCDLTVSPDGRHVTLKNRIAEIKRRYGADHVVTTAIEAGRAEFEDAVARMERMMEAAGVPIIESGELSR